MKNSYYIKLNDICELITDGTHQTPTYSDNGYIFLSSKNVTNGIIDWENVKYIPEKLHKKLYERIAPKIGDILLAKNGTTGIAALVDKNIIFDIYVSLALLRPKENILPEYLLWAINNPYTKRKFQANLKGIGVPNLHLSSIKETEIKFYEFSQQIYISNIMKRCQKIIDLKKQQLSELDRLVKFQFLKMFGMGSNDMKHIGDIANICRGASPRPISKYVTNENDGVNWIKIGDVSEKDIYITHTSEKITKDGAKKSRAVEPGDFILSNSMSFGRPYLVGINGCVHDGWLIISGYQEYLDPLFFYYELRSDLVQRQFNGSANGSCVKNLNSDLVKKVKIYVPPKEQQILFADFVKKVDKSKVIFEKTLKILDFGLNYFNVL